LRPFLYPEIWDAKKNTWKEDTKIPHDFKIVEDVSKMMVYKLDAKDGTINLLVECKDPEIAAKIVNQYLEELKNFVEVSHLTTTKMDEIFFEKQLKKVKKSLFEQSKVLTNFYRHNNVSSLKSLVALDVEADSEDKPIEEVPSDVYLNYLNGRQKLMQGLYASLEQQYQMARMSAEHNDLSFEIIDPAEVPYKKFKPQKTKIIILGTILSGFLAVVLAFFLEYVSKNKDLLKSIAQKQT
jgi:LPS O-antigen subunit length determinant protein (WzzB/FepE family)